MVNWISHAFKRNANIRQDMTPNNIRQLFVVEEKWEVLYVIQVVIVFSDSAEWPIPTNLPVQLHKLSVANIESRSLCCGPIQNVSNKQHSTALSTRNWQYKLVWPPTLSVPLIVWKPGTIWEKNCNSITGFHLVVTDNSPMVITGAHFQAHCCHWPVKDDTPYSTTSSSLKGQVVAIL